MGKIPLKIVSRIFMFFIVVGLILIIASGWITTNTLVFVGIGVCLFGLVFYAIFYRCPYCHKFIGKEDGKNCPYCGKKVRD